MAIPSVTRSAEVRITFAFEQATVSLQIEVQGDPPTLSGSGGNGNLTRVHEEAGPGRVRQPLTGNLTLPSST